jgi:hypothetical protein
MSVGHSLARCVESRFPLWYYNRIMSKVLQSVTETPREMVLGKQIVEEKAQQEKKKRDYEPTDAKMRPIVIFRTICNTTLRLRVH